jgi:hypothetical protein
MVGARPSSQHSAGPAGTAESIPARFSRPLGTIRLSLPNPGLRPSDCVLG